MKTTTNNAKQNAAKSFLRRSNRLARLWAAVIAAPAGSPEQEKAYRAWQKAS